MAHVLVIRSCTNEGTRAQLESYMIFTRVKERVVVLVQQVEGWLHTRSYNIKDEE
ncbi:hypothetical protein HPP92_000582, partial [Vanilla planifolia]